jgi:tetratricopeptide (TPR) repeat protein
VKEYLSLEVVANNLYRIGKTKEALGYYRKVMEVARAAGDTTRLTKYLGILGVLLKDQRKYKDALEYFRELYDLGDQIQDLEIKLEALVLITEVLEESGQIKESIDTIKEAVDLAKGKKDSIELFEILDYHGRLYSKDGDYDQALTVFQEGLDTARETGEISTQMRFYERVGKVYLLLEQKEDAHIQFNKGVELVDQLTENIHRKDGIRFLYDYSLVCAEEGKSKESLSLLEKATDLAAILGEMTLESRLLGQLSAISGELESYDQAIVYARRGLELAEETNDQLLMGKNAMHLAFSLSDKGEKEEALKYCELAKQAFIIEERTELAEMAERFANELLNSGDESE